MTEQERRSIVEDELFLIRDSGELPEIAYHSSLYYLTEDQDGPRLSKLINTNIFQEIIQQVISTFNSEKHQKTHVINARFFTTERIINE
jgi:hypothetical protein